MWMRRCAICGKELRKPNLEETVQCACGWRWGDEGYYVEGPCPRWVSTSSPSRNKECKD